MSKEINLVETRRLSATRDFIRSEYVKAKRKGYLDDPNFKQPANFIGFLLVQLQETGLSRGLDLDKQLINEEIAALQQEEKPEYAQAHDAHIFASTEEETALREQLTADLLLPKRTIQRIRDINKISKGIKLGPIIIKRPRRPMDEESIIQLAEYGARESIKQAIDFLETGGFRAEDKPAVVEALRNAMDHAGEGIENFIHRREDLFQGRVLIDQQGRQTSLIDREGMAKKFYTFVSNEPKLHEINKIFFNLGIAVADFSLGHPRVIADFFKIIHLGKNKIDDNDLELLNEMIVPLRATEGESEIKKLDHELVAFGLMYIDNEGCYKRVPYLEPED